MTIYFIETYQDIYIFYDEQERNHFCDLLPRTEQVLEIGEFLLAGSGDYRKK